MKSYGVIALLVVGLLTLALSYRVGHQVGDGQQWSPTKRAEFDQLELSLHDSMTPDDQPAEELQARYDKLESMRDQLEQLKRTAESKRRRLRRLGQALIVLGTALQLVTWLRLRRE